MARSTDEETTSSPEGALIGPARRMACEVTAAASDVPPLPDSFPGYEVTREIHRGGQGVIYQAIQKSTKRKVAIKVMKEGPFAGPRDKARFEREVHILGQLNHPNIVAIHDSGEAAGHFYYIMDYISGRPLDVWTTGTSRTIDEILELFAKTCEAVTAAHLSGVIHRDLKPGNILIDAQGEPHVLDFGLAKVAAGQTTAGSMPEMMTVTGQFVGSLPWASPEQARGRPEEIDTRTDVYSLGVILYHMLTGRFPYDVVGSMHDVLENILVTEPAKPSSIRRYIDNEVESIVLKCLNKERERRYHTAADLTRDIRHYLAGEPIEAKRDSGWYVVRKKLRPHRLKIAVVALFLIGIGAFSMYVHNMAHLKRAEQLVEEGRALELRGRRTEAVEKYNEALDSVPNMYKAIGYKAYSFKEQYFERDFSYQERDLLMESMKLCERGLEIKPSSYGLWNLKCALLYSLDKLPEAEAACRQALSLKEDYFYASANLAKVLTLQGKFDEAVTVANRGAMQTRQESPDTFADGVWLVLGALQLLLEQPEAAVSLQTAMDIDPAQPKNSLMLARLHLSLPGQIDNQKALEKAKHAMHVLRKHDPRFNRILSQAYLRNGDFKNAVADADWAIKLGDEPAYGHLIIAIAEANSGAPGEAEDNLRHARDNWPDGFGDNGVMVVAEKGLLWFDTAEELENLREEAERSIELAKESATEDQPEAHQ